MSVFSDADLGVSPGWVTVPSASGVREASVGKVAYTPEEAAKATGAKLGLVLESIRGRRLPARDVEGVPVVLRGDLEVWVSSFPVWDR